MAKKKAASRAASKTATKSARAATAEQPFEESLTRLHEIVADLEDGEISLEESLQRFEEGMTLLRGCHAKLTEAEQTIKQLVGFDEDGQPDEVDFDGAATTDTVEGAGRRRSSLFDE